MDMISGWFGANWGWLVLGFIVVCALAFGWGWIRPQSSIARSLTDERDRSNRWASIKDVRDLTGGETDPRRVPVGVLDKTRLFAPALRSVMVIAPSGAGKTPRVMVPAILHHHGPCVAASVKSDLLVLTQAERQRRGQVWIFDPSKATGQPGCRWSPLAQVHCWGDALSAARWLADSSKVGGLGVENSEFWESHGRRCLAPMLFAAAKTGRSMGQVTLWVQREDADAVREILDELDDEDARAFWAGHCKLHDKTRSSVWATAAQILEAWAHPDVRSTVSTTNLDDDSPVFSVDDFVASTDTLYLVAPSSDQDLFRPIFETLVNAILRRVEKLAARAAGPISPALLLALDEAANIAPLRRLDQVASKSAGEGIVLVDVWQDEGQIEQLYGSDRTRTILANHYCKLFLAGISDPRTLSALSEQIGDDEMERRTYSTAADGLRSRSSMTQEIRLAPPEWIRQLDTDRALVIMGRIPPIQVRIPGWWEDPQLRELIDPEVAAQFDARYQASRLPAKRGRQ